MFSFRKRHPILSEDLLAGIRGSASAVTVEAAIAAIAAGNDTPAERLGLEAKARRTIREFQSATDAFLRTLDLAIADAEDQVRRMRAQRQALVATRAGFAFVASGIPRGAA